ncbi:hypothetical protein ACFWIA_24575 [Streptomyces sp. NPDC127068]|uniref:hypothetical protein n=1 Tax=Streptomyces sp. NPDC127068 TaxID=3347127 RepID=UPI00366409FF
MSAAHPTRPAPALCGPPPWLWLTLVLLAVQTPGAVAAVRRAEGPFAQWRDGLGDGLLVVSGLTLAQSLPLVLLFAGALALALPHLRRRFVERRHGLMAPDDPLVPPATAAVYAQVRRFLAERAPGTVLRVSNQPRPLARVYPDGWRTTRVGVFRPLVLLWDTDREAAEAVLLHELGHLRSGEQHVAGLGSPFTSLVRAWPYLLAGFGALPVTLLFLSGNATAPLMLAQVVLVVLAVPKLLLIMVGALWSSELAADRYAGQTGGWPALLRVFDRVERRAPGRAARLYHPPVRVRRWFAARGERRSGRLLLLLLWPTALLAEALLDLLGGALAYRLLGAEWDTWGAAARAALALAHEQLAGGPLWWAVLAALLGWPLIARRWSRLWGWRGPERGVRPLAAHATAALFPAAALLVGLLAAPGESGTASRTPHVTATPSAGPGDLPSPCPSRSVPAAPPRPTGLPTFGAAGATGTTPTAARTFRTVRVSGVQPLGDTRADWARDSADRIARARWRLGTDGTLTADLDEVPALRTTSADGDTRVLSGERTRTSDTNATTTWAEAELRTSAGRPPELHLIRATTSVNHAVLACRAFDSTTTSAARLVLELGEP